MKIFQDCKDNFKDFGISRTHVTISPASVQRCMAEYAHL